MDHIVIIRKAAKKTVVLRKIWYLMRLSFFKESGKK